MKTDLEQLLNELYFNLDTGRERQLRVYPCRTYDKHGRLVGELSAKQIVLAQRRRLKGMEVRR